MRDSKKQHRKKNENTDAKKQEFELDNKQKDATIDEQLDTFAEIIVALVLKENLNYESNK